jgi:hypothetical protein
MTILSFRSCGRLRASPMCLRSRLCLTASLGIAAVSSVQTMAFVSAVCGELNS